MHVMIPGDISPDNVPRERVAVHHNVENPCLVVDDGELGYKLTDITHTREKDASDTTPLEINYSPHRFRRTQSFASTRQIQSKMSHEITNSRTTLSYVPSRPRNRIGVLVSFVRRVSWDSRGHNTSGGCPSNVRRSTCVTLPRGWRRD